MRHEEILIHILDELTRLEEDGDIKIKSSVAKMKVLLNALDAAIREHINELLYEEVHDERN